MKQPFKDASQEHFKHQRLTDKQYARFEALLQSQPEHKKNRTQDKAAVSMRLMFALSASVLLALLIWRNDVTPLINHNQMAYEQHIYNIAEEVAINHIKMKPLEFTGNTVSSLRGQFDDLDFSLVQSSHFSEQGMQGGRYCSIQGVTAAQLRYGYPDHTRATLYQVPYDQKKFGTMPKLHSGDVPLQLTIKGLNVSMWVESDVLMVSVSSI
ncbi:hypothetical protein ACU6U9_10365 [Pseudomonas sp. HK3]